MSLEVYEFQILSLALASTESTFQANPNLFVAELKYSWKDARHHLCEARKFKSSQFGQGYMYVHSPLFATVTWKERLPSSSPILEISIGSRQRSLPAMSHTTVYSSRCRSENYTLREVSQKTASAYFFRTACLEMPQILVATLNTLAQTANQTRTSKGTSTSTHQQTRREMTKMMAITPSFFLLFVFESIPAIELRTRFKLKCSTNRLLLWRITTHCKGKYARSAIRGVRPSAALDACYKS